MKIAIIGSNAFWKEMREYGDKLKKMGHEVVIPYSAENKIPREIWDNLKKQNLEEFIEKKGSVVRRYFKTIKASDAVLVLNFDKKKSKNYIGGNTLMEMAVAFEHNKKIFVLNNLPEDSNFHDELVSMKPVIIESDLTRIE